MKTLLILLSESSLAMALLYCVYWFFLRKETFFRLNRFFLVGALILSVVLPLFPLHYSVIADSASPSANLKAITSLTENGKLMADGNSDNGISLFILLILTVSYFTGAAFILLRLLFQSGQLVCVVSRSATFKLDNVYLVKNQQYNIPFSILNRIFYNPENHHEEDLAEIIVHEKVHIREHHWIDLLIAELWSVVFWFNPFVWLYERSIKQNHEFLADAGVLAQGRPVGRYQALLINQLMGSQVIGLANHLNFGVNATRFKMMTKKEMPKIRVVRIAWALPVLALLLVAFAEPTYQQNPSGNNTMNQGMALTANPSDQVKVTGEVLKPDGTPLEGASVVIKGTTTGTMTNKDGYFNLLIPESQTAELVISFVGYETKVQRLDTKTRDIKLKIDMKVCVVEIGTKSAFMSSATPPPPPPPPPPASGTEKPQKVVEKSAISEKEVFIAVEEMPQYPGGSYELQKYVTEMQQKLAQAKNLQGKAVVEFTVNEEGKAVNPVIKEQENEGAGKGAISIVTNMKQWEPGKQRGKSVPVRYSLTVSF